MAIPKPNWAALPDGVISSIAKLLEPGEFISFRGTCTSWRLATIYKDFQKEWFPGLPFLMFWLVKDGGVNRDIFNFYKGKSYHIGYWKTGDPAWTTMDTLESVRDVSFHKGMFYFLSYPKKVWKLDVFSPDPTIPIEIMDLRGNIDYNSLYYEAFLVEYGGTLLAVSSSHRFYPYRGHRVFELVELDLINATCKKITNLGNKAVFIGNNEGFCVDAMRFPGFIRPNYIYQSNGSYQIAGREDIIPDEKVGMSSSYTHSSPSDSCEDISPDEKVGMFSSYAHSSPSHKNCFNVWVTPNL